MIVCIIISNIICVGCEPRSITNGDVTYSQGPSNGVYKPNTVSTATCDSGYEKTAGWFGRTCQSNGNWNGADLACTAGKWEH